MAKVGDMDGADWAGHLQGALDEGGWARASGKGLGWRRPGRIMEEAAGMEAAGRDTVEAARGIWRKGSAAPYWSLPPHSPAPLPSEVPAAGSGRPVPGASSVPALTVSEFVHLGLPRSLIGGVFPG